jgi:hypothetical protein
MFRNPIGHDMLNRKNKQSGSLSKTLAKSDKGVSEAKNTPAVLVRSLFLSRNITMGQFEKYLSDWVKRNISSNVKQQSSAKSNISRSANEPEVTWNTLLRIASILRLRRLTITMEAEWEDGRVTYQQDTVLGDSHYIDSTESSPHDEDPGYIPKSELDKDQEPK